MKSKVFKKNTRLTKSLIVLIMGILLLNLPFTGLTDYSDFFRFLTVGLILGGIIFIFFAQFFQNIFISDEEISKIQIRASNQFSTAKISFPKISISSILLAVIIGGFLFNQFILWKMDSSGILNKLFSVSINITRKSNK